MITAIMTNKNTKEKGFQWGKNTKRKSKKSSIDRMILTFRKESRL